jgi:LuxR family maltose regulon positive regulatory protein
VATDVAASELPPPPDYSFKPVETRLFAAMAMREALPKITTVVAPPGYGKTVFLSELYKKYKRSGVHCLWIALDDRDASFSNLLRLFEIATGLDSPDMTIYEKLSQSDSFDRIEDIRQRFSIGPGPTIIFIDNIDFCRVAGVDRLLNALVFNTPSWLKLFVSSSSTPVPFNAGRAHVELNLQTIKASDLSFDRQATSALFDSAGLSGIDRAALDEIVDKTEGWPAAIRLLQLTAQAGGGLNCGIDLLAGHEGHISDILSERLMSSFDSELVNFLYEIAEFRHFSVELAEIATDNPRAAIWIQFLIDRNIMIIPLDNKNRWFRFHTLFRQFLVQEARERYSVARRSEVHAKAARWLMRQGDQKSAFDLAMNAGERELIAEILDRAACALVREQGDTATFINWIQSADEVGVKRGHLATFWYAWALMFERRFWDAKEEIRAAYAQIAASADEPGSAELRSKLATAEIATSIHLDASESAIAVSEAWLRDNPNAEPFDFGVAAAGGLGLARFSRNEYNAARHSLRIARSTIFQSNSVYGRCWIESIEAMREICQGDPALAERELSKQEQAAREQITPTASILSVVAIVRARALLEMGRLSEAEEIVAEHLLRATANGVPDSTWVGLEVALASTVGGKSVFALDDLRAIVKAYPKRIGVLFELKLIQELAEAGSVDAALDRADELGWSAKSGWSADLLANASKMELSAARMTSGALLMAGGHFASAQELFQQEILCAQETGRRRDQIDLHLAAADAHFRTDARMAALRSFTRAIVLTTKRQIYRPYFKRRRLVAHLHESTRPKELGLSNMDEYGTLTQVFSMLGLSESKPADLRMSEGVVAPPTPREIELLHCIEAGLDNSQIAERLSVSVRTIKWHLSNLYFKLDVKNRSAAVAKGRALRLLR